MFQDYVEFILCSGVKLTIVGKPFLNLSFLIFKVGINLINMYLQNPIKMLILLPCPLNGLCILGNNSITQVIMYINKLKVKNYKVHISSDDI